MESDLNPTNTNYNHSYKRTYWPTVGDIKPFATSQTLKNVLDIPFIENKMKKIHGQPKNKPTKMGDH